MKKKVIKSTYDKFYEKISKDPNKKSKFDSELKAFHLSELILSFMEKENLSIRDLAALSGVSKSQIQNLRSEESLNVTLKTMSSVLKSLGGVLYVKRNSKYYPLQPST